MKELIEKLAAPFDPSRVSWRVGSTTQAKDKGMALAYIDSRDVQDRLDAVCGAAGWQCRYPHAGQKTVCEIGVKIEAEWIWKADGAGDSDVEAEKGALSDAFKRAAVKWGIGRYLYDIESPWVAIVARGKSYVIADHETARLQKILAGNKPAPPTAPGVSEARVWVREHIRDLESSESSTHFMEQVGTARARWIKICAVYPNVWAGADGGGLRGEATRFATIMECRQEFDAFLKAVELAAKALNQPKQAAE